MPYCVHCGNTVGAASRFCGKCGASQPDTGPAAAPAAGFGSGISDRHAALLCYIPMVGWIAAIVVLANQRFRHQARVRFHAFQGLYVFVAWLIVDWVVRPALFISGGGLSYPFHRLASAGLQALILAAWIVMIVKVSHDQDYHLPVFGELAERSASEQRP
jgi:uncharacterized membrane protein